MSWQNSPKHNPLGMRSAKREVNCESPITDESGLQQLHEKASSDIDASELANVDPGVTSVQS